MKTRNTAVYVVEDSPIVSNLLTELIEATGATVVGHADWTSQDLMDSPTRPRSRFKFLGTHPA